MDNIREMDSNYIDFGWEPDSIAKAYQRLKFDGMPMFQRRQPK